MTKGNISERDFDILIKLSGIHSEKAILALKKYYVDGVIRKRRADQHICTRNQNIEPRQLLTCVDRCSLCIKIPLLSHEDNDRMASLRAGETR